MRSKVKAAKKAGKRAGKAKEKRKDKRKISAEERQMRALKAKMGHYKKGSKEHKAALRKMAAKVRAAKRAGKKAGKAKEKRKDGRKLSKEEHAMRRLKAKMSHYKKGSK